MKWEKKSKKICTGAAGIHYCGKHLGWFSFLADDYPSQISIVVPGPFWRWTDHPDHLTLPLQTCKADVKAPAHLRSYLTLKARAWITTDSQQHPKEMIPKHRSDTKYPLGTRAVGCLFSQTPPLLLTADAEINLLRCHIGAWRQASGKGGGVGVGEGEGFFSFCKHPVLPLTSLTGGNQLKKKKKKSYSKVPNFFGEVPQFSPLLCSNFCVAATGQWAKAALTPWCQSPLVWTGTVLRFLSA